MKKHKGFTLTELLIALAIMGIIAAIALPTFRDSILRSNRTDAFIMLTRLTTLEEQYYFRSNQYTGDFADIVTGLSTGAPVITDDGHYSVVVTLTGGGTGWSMTASAVGEQLEDTDCAKFILTSLGAQSALDSAGDANADCW